MAKKRTGILTGGSDVPGLNSVIKSVIYRGAELGCEAIGSSYASELDRKAIVVKSRHEN